MNKDWHSGHFCCWQCDESLTGQRYVLRDDHPYCIKCYENVFANTCDECNKIIGIDSKVILIICLQQNKTKKKREEFIQPFTLNWRCRYTQMSVFACFFLHHTLYHIQTRNQHIFIHFFCCCYIRRLPNHISNNTQSNSENICRICPTRKSIGTKSVSYAISAAYRWLTNNSVRNPKRFTAAIVMTHNSHHVVTAAAKYFVLVCITLYFTLQISNMFYIMASRCFSPYSRNHVIIFIALFVASRILYTAGLAIFI